jgi:hypothetical protein
VKRRALLAAGATLLPAASALACARDAPVEGVVAFPERSLAYAPLLAAVQAGLHAEPPVRVALMQRAAGPDVAAAVGERAAEAGAMALPDFVEAVAAGAPLVAVGALTVRLAAALVVAARPGLPERTLEAICGGAWHGLRVGVERGAGGTETFVRLFALDRGLTPAPPGRALLAPDPAAGEPRWAAFETGEALVAALKDDRLDAFVGRAYAAAQVSTLGGGDTAANYAAGGSAGDVAAVFATLLVAHQEAVAHETAASRRLARLVPACARAARELSGVQGEVVLRRALPEQDALHLELARRLAAPSPETSSFALDGRLPPGAIERYLALVSLAGRARPLSAAGLTSARFTG